MCIFIVFWALSNYIMPDLIHANKNGTFFQRAASARNRSGIQYTTKGVYSHRPPFGGAPQHGVNWRKRAACRSRTGTSWFWIKVNTSDFRSRVYYIIKDFFAQAEKSRSKERLFRWNYSDTSDPRCAHKGIKRLRILYHACLIHANRKAAGLPATDDFLRKDFRTKDSEMILKK